jgi:hypothetical protein
MGGTEADHCYGITVDGAGNVIKTGGYTGAVDFDPSATEEILPATGGTQIFIQKLT